MRLPQALRTEVPLISAPMAGPGGGRLAHAVSVAGALGTFGVNDSRSPEWIAAEAAVAGADGTPYGVGLAAWALEKHPEQLDVVLDLRPTLVSVSFGDYAPAVALLREAGILTATQIGSLDDLEGAIDAGVDVIVARGGEGGGHGRNVMATLPLLQLVLDRTELPVYAAGGILNHRGLAAVLAAGAAGAWVGTAFLSTTEAASTPAAKQALFAADSTGYGRVFDEAQQVDWPREYGGRSVANRFFEEWVGREDELDEGSRSSFRAAVSRQDYSIAHLYAGEGVTALSHEVRAADVVAEFARGVRKGA